MNGTTRTSTAILANTYNSSDWYPVRAGDFNGDGHADILLRSADASGRLCIWFMSGTTRTSTAILANTYNSMVWYPIAVTDFNGDGKSDILFSAGWPTDIIGDSAPPALNAPSNGRLCIWTMNGATRTASTALPDTFNNLWYVVAAGDYDGDGQSDILFRSGDGRICVWFMNGTTRLWKTTVPFGTNFWMW